MKVLLVEPKSSTTYPPLGLMKIATYHKLKGDEVHYVIGNNATAHAQFWDAIYITTVFTYDLKQAVSTINYYSKNFFNFKNIRVGGVAATLMPEYIEKSTGIKPHIGLLNSDDDFLKMLSDRDPRFFYLKECNPSIDNLPPDYSIFPEDTKYKKILDNSYFLYATKGCRNKCDFCAVKVLEPRFVHYIPIMPRISYIKDNFGARPNITFLDNNIAASKCYKKILSEIKNAGFEKNATFEYEKLGRVFRKKRAVDFNQGVDARLMDEEKLELISQICINPLRLAFDDIKLKDIYIEKIELAISKGILDISNYMLFNHEDTPEDLYQRMLINTKIKEKYPQIRIFSFPMRYSPILKTDRLHTGRFWHRRQIRAFQLILNATHGIVSHKPNFFYRAFGRKLEEFLQLLSMPFRYIINRDLFEFGIPESYFDWKLKFSALNDIEKKQLLDLLELNNRQQNSNIDTRLALIMRHYENDSSVVIPKQQLQEERSSFFKRIAPPEVPRTLNSCISH